MNTPTDYRPVLTNAQIFALIADSDRLQNADAVALVALVRATERAVIQTLRSHA